jgi:hypothetical protein
MIRALRKQFRFIPGHASLPACKESFVGFIGCHIQHTAGNFAVAL